MSVVDGDRVLDAVSVQDIMKSLSLKTELEH
jgi:hypothetical protein